MARRISWIARVFALAVVAAGGAAVMMALSTAGEPVEEALPAEPAAPSAGCASALEAETEGIVEPAVDLGRQGDLLEPAAICRLMPECWTNADCDAKCGAGLGKCVHSNCPVRICRCR